MADTDDPNGPTRVDMDALVAKIAELSAMQQEHAAFIAAAGVCLLDLPGYNVDRFLALWAAQREKQGLATEPGGATPAELAQRLLRKVQGPVQ